MDAGVADVTEPAIQSELGRRGDELDLAEDAFSPCGQILCASTIKLVDDRRDQLWRLSVKPSGFWMAWAENGQSSRRTQLSDLKYGGD
jgi:hypothetical protein